MPCTRASGPCGSTHFAQDSMRPQDCKCGDIQSSLDTDHVRTGIQGTTMHDTREPVIVGRKGSCHSFPNYCYRRTILYFHSFRPNEPSHTR